MPREILVDWTTASGSDHRSVTFWNDATPVAEQRVALKAFLDTIKSQLDNGVTWTIETSGRELDDDTGVLTGVWSEATASTGVGVVNGEPVADATQVLVQWSTDTIVGGRFLKGRTYIPGLSTSNLSNGNVASATISAWTTAAAALIAAGKQFGVWHRPKQIVPGTPGSAGGLFEPAETGAVWSELAVLRKRRS